MLSKWICTLSSCLGLHKKEFNFNKLIGNKPGTYSTEFIQADNPSNKNRMKS